MSISHLKYTTIKTVSPSLLVPPRVFIKMKQLSLSCKQHTRWWKKDLHLSCVLWNLKPDETSIKFNQNLTMNHFYYHAVLFIFTCKFPVFPFTHVMWNKDSILNNCHGINFGMTAPGWKETFQLIWMIWKVTTTRAVSRENMLHYLSTG